MRVSVSSLGRAASVAAAVSALLVAGGCHSRAGSCAPPCEPPPCAPPAPAPCAPPPPPPCAPPVCAAEPKCPQPVATRVLPGDVLHGRLTCKDGCQCFYFEGVEYSVFNFTLRADEKCVAAPQIAIEDPDGRPLLLAEDVVTRGNVSSSSCNLILRRSGTYKATVCKPAGSPETYYAFTHELRLANPDDKSVYL